LFTEYLNEPPRERILCFYGDGGNGKSLLLKFLREKCSKQFTPKEWEQLNKLDDAAAAKRIELTEINLNYSSDREKEA